MTIDPLTPGPSPVHLLLVEDDPGDVLMTREALADRGLAHTLDVVGNGEEAIAYLRREGPYAEAPTPHLVLLDLNLPRCDGREVLAEVKSDPELQHIPVVVLTTSDAESDVIGAYRLHANAFITKPVEFAAFRDAIGRIDEFFLSVVRLPNRPITHRGDR